MRLPRRGFVPSTSVARVQETPPPESRDDVPDLEWPKRRAAVIRNALAIGVTTGLYAPAFGAIAVATGLSVLQTCVLSLAMFTGASQFALVGVLGAGGGVAAASATAILLGARNMFYGLRLSHLLGVGGARRLVAAELVIDESTAMSLGGRSARADRLGFWATGLSVYVCWNIGTVAGAVGARALSNPRTFGLDAAAPAAFLALLSPHVRSRGSLGVAVVAAAVGLAAVPILPAGSPVLAAGLVAVIVGATARRPRSAPGEPI